MIKPFSNLIYKKKDKNFDSSKNKLKKEENVKSTPLIIFGITSWYSSICIDLIINSWCLFLMYKKSGKMFNFLCGYFHILITKCVYKSALFIKAIKIEKKQNTKQKIPSFENKFFISKLLFLINEILFSLTPIIFLMLIFLFSQ